MYDELIKQLDRIRKRSSTHTRATIALAIKAIEQLQRERDDLLLEALVERRTGRCGK